MPWLKSGDNAATYPTLLEVGLLEDADERLLNEVAGFVWRCGSQSAGHLTNSVIDAGTAFLLGGSRTRALLDAAVRVGLMTTVKVDGKTAWLLVEDPDFLHIRDRESVRFDQQRDRDRRTPELTTAVRRRDGDACRYCGCVVNFSARKGGRSGTYDHVDPGKPASVDTYVVACRSHNSSMQDGERLPLLAPPGTPYYTSKTLAWLEENGRKPLPGTYVTDPHPADDPEITEGGHRRDTARPDRSTGDTAPPRDLDHAGSAATQAPQHSATPERDPFAAAEEALDQRERRSRSDLGTDPDHEGGSWTGRDGMGQARSGRDGPGRDGPGRVGAGAAQRRRRGRRGRRGSAGGGGVR